LEVSALAGAVAGQACGATQLGSQEYSAVETGNEARFLTRRFPESSY
jgi:hypothetical protein